MEQVIEQNNEKQKVVDILPLKKWKRLVTFLADLMINFIFLFLLYNLAVLPLGKVITGYDKKNTMFENSVYHINEIFYRNEIVHVSPDYTRNDIDLNVEFTYDCWLSYYTSDDEATPNSKYEQFGHKQNNEVIYHFYNDIRKNSDPYYELFNKYNGKNQYFVLEENVFHLKDNVKTELKAYFEPANEMGKTGQTFYKNVQESVFLPLLSEVFSDIKKNDLSYKDGESEYSYIPLNNTITEINRYHDTLLTVTAIISYLLAWSISFILVPMLNRNRKTLAMMMMRVERVNINKLALFRKPDVIVSSIYALFTNLFVIFFVPISYVAFNYLFSLFWLLYLSVASLFVCLVSLFFVLFNGFNRSISDIFSRSIMLTTNHLDDIYRARGYII